MPTAELRCRRQESRLSRPEAPLPQAVVALEAAIAELTSLEQRLATMSMHITALNAQKPPTHRRARRARHRAELATAIHQRDQIELLITDARARSEIQRGAVERLRSDGPPEQVGGHWLVRQLLDDELARRASMERALVNRQIAR
jgi:hypothetical protein